jgi:hypothetical protein
VVWQALGADPRQIPASSAAQRLSQDGRPPHLVWNPLSGDIVQLIPVVRAACSLGGPEGLDYRVMGLARPGGAAPACDPANRQGRLCVQVGVVAWAWEPFTDGPMHGAEALLGWLASWGVPSRWPAGRPAPFMRARSAARSRTHWSMGGHFGASQVPGWDAAGPGHIEPALLGAPTVPHCTGPHCTGPHCTVPHCTGPHCTGVAGRRSTLTAAPATIGRARRMALEAVITPDIDSVASVASLANAPY